MLQDILNLFLKLKEALTDRFNTPEAVTACKQAIFKYPEEHPEFSSAIPLPPETWSLDAVDRMETLRSIRDIYLIKMSHRTALAQGLIAPTVQSSEYLEQWRDILHYKYPYTQVSNGN